MFMDKYNKVFEEFERRMLENRKRVIELVKRYKNGDKDITIKINRTDKSQTIND